MEIRNETMKILKNVSLKFTNVTGWRYFKCFVDGLGENILTLISIIFYKVLNSLFKKKSFFFCFVFAICKRQRFILKNLAKSL